MHRSVATIDAPEFINLQPLDLNPLMSSCDIKVMYVGENRNRSYMSKEVAMDMAKTLRGCPIVGYYKDEKQDFGDHGQKMTIDDEGVHFECLTKPYGFVAPDAEVWFQKFEDYDEFGNSTVHEYLMTKGYLWTEQFPECKAVIEEGRPQSMELDESTLDGHWSENIKTGVEFFIINDAIFSKLCILGEETEPCFEGASVTSAANYTLDDEFKNSLYSMMKDMQKITLQGGQQQMEDVKNIVETGVEFTEEVETVEEVEETVEEITEVETTEEIVEEVIEETVEEIPTETFEKEEEEEEEDSEESSEDSEEEKEEDDDKTKHSLEETTEEEIVEDFESKYQLLEEQFNSLQSQFTELKAENEELRAFKNSIEDAEKDELIKEFYMLSDEDKADVIAHKSEYSYKEIESQLSVICFRKKINFTNETKEEKPAMTFSITDNEDNSVPDMISALRETKNKLNN